MAGQTQKISPRKLADLRANSLYLTQDELGARIGVTGGRVAAWEQSGNESSMSMTSFRKLADLAKLTPDQLKERIGNGNAASPITVAEAEAKLAEVVVRLPPEHDGELSADMRAAVKMLRRGKTPTTTPGKKKGK